MLGGLEHHAADGTALVVPAAVAENTEQMQKTGGAATHI